MDEIIDEFEKDLINALQYKYRRCPEKQKKHLIENSPVIRMKIKEFYKLYLSNDVYPKERIEKLVYLLFDIKIQLFFILELDMGLYNHLLHNVGFGNKDIQGNPYLLLRNLSLDQNMIVKSRILWERVMNFIYFLEKGEALEVKSSKKRAFFKLIADGKWSYLLKYKDFINWFDDKLRTPEVHTSSVLRKDFLKNSTPSSDKVLGLVNILMNCVWPNLLDIIQGREPSSRYWDIAMEDLK